MELVLLHDVQNSYGSNWARIANTEGVADIHIGDRFREKGFGLGAEELEVAGVDISPVGGMSRIFFNRGGNATKPEVHRLGAVFEQVGIKGEVYEPKPPVEGGTFQIGKGADYPPANGSAAVVSVISSADDTTSTAPIMTPLKRKRGRPPGSKNKPKEVALPAGF